MVLSAAVETCITAQHNASVVYAVVVCPSICSHISLSVTHMYCTKTAKLVCALLSALSRKQRHMIAHSIDSSFLVPKISVNFQRYHSQRGRQIEMGWVKMGNFRPVSRYISKMVQGDYFGIQIGTRMHSIEWRYFQ